MAKILVVEDEFHIARVMVMWLERHGHEIHEASDGNAALALLARHEGLQPDREHTKRTPPDRTPPAAPMIVALPSGSIVFPTHTWTKKSGAMRPAP